MVARSPPLSPYPRPPSAAYAYEQAIALAQYQAGFLANTSHELRSPLNRVISLHQLILEDLCDSPEEERLFLQQAYAATQAVLKQLDLLIGLSKLEIGRTPLDPQPLSVRELLDQLTPLVELQAANRSCRLTVVAAATEGYLYGDPQALQQALILLVEGAIAAGSQQLYLAAEAAGDRICLQLEQDVPVAAWQGFEGAIAPAPPAPPALSADMLSPAFKQQLAARILAQMGSKLVLSPGAAHLLGAAEASRFSHFEISFTALAEDPEFD